MYRKEKCRRWNAGTPTAVFRPQSMQLSFSTTLTARQETAPHAASLVRNRSSGLIPHCLIGSN
jgi:hypothetical protein